ncbi:MAG: UDP-N-acetylglucosamine 2-epimerase (hydrolyzing) [Lachnospiraceae bacterium]|nr:UDP-N-acetylglucosamine 2-epimerase (hydrolyzing) [Lachnospiraceae bacterium]
MNKIAIITSTRAEYGLLQPVLREFRKHESDDLGVFLVVTGTHLSEAHGFTVKEIEEAGDRIDFKIPVGVGSGSAVDIAKNEADTVVKFTELFEKEKFSTVVVLGDRYEILMVALAAVNTSTPIFHIGGGDTTEGAADECFRHSISKMSYLHFPSNEESRKRIIQLGEAPERVFNVGATGVDNILNYPLVKSDEVLAELGVPVRKYAICTYHPTTIGENDIEAEMAGLISAISEFSDMEFIVTKSNSDLGGAMINDIWEKAASTHPNIHLFASLGMRRYLSLLKNAEFMLGNSSSGIIEAPAMHIPTVNIGDRQRGRLRSESILNCRTSKDDIVLAMRKALSDDMKQTAKEADCPFGDGHAAEGIVEQSLKTLKTGIDLKKTFKDITWKS